MGGANGDADIDALLREFPALGRTEDGRVRCALTGHVMACKPEVVRPYVKGKKFAAALAKMKEAESLKEYEPHIVRSKFLPDKLFCRITGRYVQARESAVVQHSAGRRFARGVEMLTDGSGAKLLTEKPPGEVDAERERAEEAKRVAAAEKRAAAAVAAEAKRAARQAAKAAEDPKLVAERERIRVNGGFSQEMGCWIPPRTSSTLIPSSRMTIRKTRSRCWIRRMTRKVPSLSRIRRRTRKVRRRRRIRRRTTC